MRKFFREGMTSLLIVLATMPFSQVSAQEGSIASVIPISASTVEKYKKYEAAIQLNRTYGNVYDFDSVNVYAIINTPSNAKDTIDGFWMQDFVNPDPTTHNLSPTGVPSFRIRYSPKEIGAYSYTIYVKDRAGTSSSVAYYFTSAITNSKGFIRKNNSNYLNHDDGSAFIPIGQNMAYTTGYLYPDYNKWMDSAALYNQNLVRAWATSDAFGIEWKAGKSLAYAQFEGLKKYEQKRAWALDWLLNKAENKNMYVMLTQLVHNEMLAGTNGPRWMDNPYNIVNGGMCDTTWDFFKNAIAIKVFKNRLRYMVARYGFSVNIQSWELTNEINNTDGFYAANKDSVRLWVRQWHDTMASYIKKIDPNKHLVTTSYGGYDYNDHDSATWHIPSLDVTSWHWYDASASPQDLAKQVTKKYLADFNKPTQQAEAGWSIQQPSGFENIDINGVQLHNLIWASAFSGAMGPAMQWNWDDYIAYRKLNYHYKNLQTATGKFDLARGNFKPQTTPVTGSNEAFTQLVKPMGPGFCFPVNLTSFTIDNEGEMTPAADKLGIMIMGSNANTQFRSPPTFHINYFKAGTFTVETVAVATGGARVSIYVDGLLTLNVAAASNTSYTVNIPAGPHSIKLDNLGSDWFQAKDFRFGNAGNPLGTASLKNSSNTKVVGHVLNKNYNWKWFTDSTGQPPVVSGAVLNVPGMLNGEYLVTFKNTLTNSNYSTQNILVTNGNLAAAIPAIAWDAYYTIEPVTTNPNQLPIANAGANKQLILPANSTSLDGSGADPDGTIVSYAWVKISGPATGALNNATADTANATNLIEGLYIYRLTVTDNAGATASDTVSVTVNKASNKAPTANAGADKSINLPVTNTTLDGSATDPDGTIVAYAWIKIAGPATGTLNNANAALANVTNLVEGVYSYQLTVTDNAGATASDTVLVTVNAAPNQAPGANAGRDKTISLPTNSTTLDGSGTDTDGTIVGYAWVKIAGPATGILANANAAVANLTSLVQGVYSYQLTVTDNTGATASDTVSVTVNASTNQAPVANAGRDISIYLPVDNTLLTGMGTDADGTIAAYYWRVIGGPSQYLFTSPTAAVTYIKNLRMGVYKIEFAVKDNAGAFGYDTVLVNVLKQKRNVTIKLDAYPNPVTNALHVTLENVETTEQTSLALYDSKGLIVYKKSVLLMKSKRIEQINMSGFSRGHYYLQVSYGAQTPIIRSIIKM
jgi:Secretion system C-terminal sorting domain/Domain of unknown function (DUF5060)